MNKLYRIAVLVDGDNISPKKLKEIVSFTSNYCQGHIVIRKIFGDWTHSNLTGWKKTSSEFGFRLVQATAYTSGKNTSDLSIVMEAMDIMYLHLAEVVCIASSDGDFTALAQRLRESGIMVLGFGANNTPVSLVNSCDGFLKCKDNNERKNHQKDSKPKHNKTNISLLQKDRNLFIQAYHLVAKNKKETTVSELSSHIQKQIKNFKTKKYGYNTIAKIYEVLGFIIIKKKKQTIVKMPINTLDSQ